jgi:hypothetical protein
MTPPVFWGMVRVAPMALSLALLPLAGCAVNLDHQGYIEHEEKRFPVTVTVDLHLYTFDGAVEVRSWDKPECVIDVEKRGQDKEAVGRIEVIAERTENRIQIEARRPGGSNVFVGIGRFTSPSAKIIATVPRNTNLVVRSGDGSVMVERVTGRLELRTDDGSIRAIETAGDLLAETGDGTIQIEEAEGRVEARTSDGSIRLTGTPSIVRARSEDGGLTLRVRRGAAMTGDWMLATRDGAVTVELPDDFDALVEAEPGPGDRARSELTLVDEAGGTREDRTLRGRLGKGGHRLTIRTGDGSVRLNRY